MDFNTAIDWDEAFEFMPGLVVELKSQPGVIDTIAEYDLTMVPPIWLEHDPCPRYPHELQIVSRSKVKACDLLLENVSTGAENHLLPMC